MKKSYKTLGAAAAATALLSAASAKTVSAQPVIPGAQIYSIRMVQEDKLYQAIYEIIRKVTDMPESQVLSPEMLFKNIMDSIDFVDFIMVCENVFDIEIPEEKANFNGTIEEFHNYLIGEDVKYN